MTCSVAYVRHISIAMTPTPTSTKLADGALRAKPECDKHIQYSCCDTRLTQAGMPADPQRIHAVGASSSASRSDGFTQPSVLRGRVVEATADSGEILERTGRFL